MPSQVVVGGGDVTVGPGIVKLVSGRTEVVVEVVVLVVEVAVDVDVDVDVVVGVGSEISAVSELLQAPRMRVKDRSTNVDFKKGCISLLRMF